MLVNFAIEKGLRIYKQDSDTLFIDVLFDAGAPLGTSGETDEAPIGSIYTNSTNGDLYTKIANTSSASDWQLNEATGAQLGNWRPERVDAHTGQVLAAGVTDPTAWSDNDGGADGTDFTVGHYVLDGNCALWEITAIGGATSITLAAAANAPVADDMFAVKYNLPDPAGQENQAIIVFDGTGCVKVADVDWEFATGINLSGGYTPGSGDITSADSVESAIEKLDGNNDAQDQALGISQGDTDMGTYTGNIISDNVSQTTVNQELEDAIEAISTQSNGTVAQATPTNVDNVLVDEIQRATWIVVARDTANPDRVKSFEVNAIHNGHAGADATNTDHSVSERINRGNVNVQVDVVLTGAAGTQAMNLELDTNEAGGITYTVERVNTLPLAG